MLYFVDLILLFYDDDLKVLQNRLSEVSIKNTDKEFHAMIERFQNKLIIQKEQIENIQRYWKIYLKTTDHITQKSLSTDIKMIINEINHYLDKHDLIENN